MQAADIELRLRQLGNALGAGRCPQEAALVQAPRCAPHAEAVVHEQLQPRAAGVGEEVTSAAPNTATAAASSRSGPARMSMGSAGAGRDFNPRFEI